MLGRKLDIKVQKPRGQTTLQIQIWGIIRLSMIFETMVQVLRMMCQVRREESLGHSLTIQHYLMTDKYEETEMVKSERWSQIQETGIVQAKGTERFKNEEGSAVSNTFER